MLRLRTLGDLVTTSTNAANPYELNAREAKAQRLARRAIEALIATASDAATDKGKAFWDLMLKQESASDETKSRVVKILRMLRPVKLEGWDL